MKRILLALGVVATACLIGCGGGGGGSTPSAPSNPGNPGGGSTATPGPTPTPSNSQNPTSTVVTIGTPGPMPSQVAINSLGSNATQLLTTTGRVSATQNGTPMAAGAAINVTITSSDKSGSTCLVYVANGSTTGSPCTYPAAGSTPAPVTIAHVNDGVAVQYNSGPMAPGGSFTIAGTVPGAGSQPASVTESNPAPSVGHNTTAFSGSYGGGGIVYSSGNIYTTQNSASSPIGITSYANGVAGASVSSMLVAGSLTNAPAGGLILGPDGNLWGTEQNASKVFKVSPLGGPVTEVAISCPNGSSGGSGTGVLGPQTGIVSGGGNVYVLCADEASHAGP
ncbi:MAG TPA: hypothetical protein VMD07_01730, partial [Candidatus Acidoferrales bacterium]|nr:hypothetical protein [Candidatus Acidoferrales bacterium]